MTLAICQHLLYIVTKKKNTIDYSRNNIENSASKHMDIKYHFLKDHISKGYVNVLRVDSYSNIADIFIKPLPKSKVLKFGDSFLD